jgi:hypothetical protein
MAPPIVAPATAPTPRAALVEPEDAPALLREEVPGEAFTPERLLLALEPVVAIEPLDRAPGALFALTERGQKVGLPRQEMALDRVLLPERMLHRARHPVGDELATIAGTDATPLPIGLECAWPRRCGARGVVELAECAQEADAFGESERWAEVAHDTEVLVRARFHSSRVIAADAVLSAMRGRPVQRRISISAS